MSRERGYEIPINSLDDFKRIILDDSCHCTICEDRIRSKEKMTNKREQAIEKIAHYLVYERYSNEPRNDLETLANTTSYPEMANDIMRLVESLGYVQMPSCSEDLEREIVEFAEFIYNLKPAMSIANIKNNIKSFLLANHLVQIAKDQSLPENPHSDERTLHIKYNQGLKSGFIEGQNSLLKTGWVKVEKE